MFLFKGFSFSLLWTLSIECQILVNFDILTTMQRVMFYLGCFVFDLLVFLVSILIYFFDVMANTDKSTNKIINECLKRKQIDFY